MEVRKSKIGSRNWKLGKANPHQDRRMYLYCDSTYMTRMLTQARRLCQGHSFWRLIGQTAARPTAYPNGKRAEGRKDIYVYPLCDDWQQVLCAEPEVALCSTPPAEAPADWTESVSPHHQERMPHRGSAFAG
jgi:hypothetical protein